MLRSLLTTGLLLIGKFNLPIQQTKVQPYKIVEQSNIAITGYYNIKDEMEWPNQYGSIQIIEESQAIECYAHIENKYLKVIEMTLNYSMQNAPNYTMSIECLYYDEDEGYNTTGTWALGGGTNAQYKYLSNYNDVAKNLILYFPSQFYFNETSDNYFSGIFTHSNNAYITSYDGYINLAVNYVSSDYDIYGNFIIDNSLYKSIFDEAGDTLMYGTYIDYNGNEQIIKERYLFGNDRAPKDRNIYANITKLPLVDKAKIENFAVFTYVQPAVEQYSFSEFMFSIMDAPLYYLTSMFNFELFGMNMYVALASLVTLAIIIIVIKKVI